MLLRNWQNRRRGNSLPCSFIYFLGALLAGLLAWQSDNMAQEKPSNAAKSDGVETAVTPATGTETIAQSRPTFFVHAEADRKSLEYWDGEQLSITVRCEVEAYLYVLYTQVDQKSYIVFPNSGGTNNRVPANQPVQIPAVRDAFRWTVSAPFGKERMKVIASKRRIEALEKPEVRRGDATLIVQEEIAKVVAEIKAKIPASDWSEVSLEITTHPGINPESPYAGKRYGLFFAVPIVYADAILERAEIKPTGQLGPVPLFDSLLVQRALTVSSPFDAVRSLPDPRHLGTTATTKDRMRELVADWLPQVTKPGDTVTIFFSGHGATVADRNSPNGRLTYLVPADCLDIRSLFALRKLKSSGKAEASDLRLLDDVETWLRDANIVIDFDLSELKTMTETRRKAAFDTLQDADTLLIRKTCVTDNEFAHWLQRLPNRRLVIVLHACHSGAFAPAFGGNATKGELKELELPSTPALPFEFLSPQLGRLKSLGQTQTALIAAAQADQTAKAPHYISSHGVPLEPATVAWRSVFEELKTLFGDRFPQSPPAEFEMVGVFTYYLANVLLKEQGSVDVETAAVACSREMKQYFASEVLRAQVAKQKIDAATVPHQPFWFDNIKPKALLRP